MRVTNADEGRYEPGIPYSRTNNALRSIKAGYKCRLNRENRRKKSEEREAESLAGDNIGWVMGRYNLPQLQ